MKIDRGIRKKRKNHFHQEEYATRGGSHHDLEHRRKKEKRGAQEEDSGPPGKGEERERGQRFQVKEKKKGDLFSGSAGGKRTPPSIFSKVKRGWKTTRAPRKKKRP